MDESITNKRKINVAKLEEGEPKFEIKKAAKFEMLNGKQIEIEDTELETVDPRETKLRNSIGYLFASSPDIVKNILSCMTYYDLCKIRTVCTFWNSTTEKIIGKRRKVLQYVCHYLDVFADVGHDGPVTTDTVMQSIKEQFSTHPNICLVFQNESSKVRKQSYFETNFSSSIRNYLPPNCITINAMCTRIIGTHERDNLYQLTNAMKKSRIGKVISQPSKKCRYNPFPDTNGDHFSLFYYENLQKVSDLVKHKKYGFYVPLPGKGYSTLSSDPEPCFQFTMLTMPDNIPGVEIIPISMKQGNSESDYTEEQLKDVKAVLVLGTNDTCNVTIHYLDEVMSRNKEEVAISGAYVDCITATIPSSGYDEPMDNDNLCIAFKGKSLKAASIIIPPELPFEEDEGSDNDLKKFKDKGFYDPTKQSFAFMFVGLERGCGKIEVTMFRRFYPNTPVFGAFGRRGQIGWEYFPGVTKIDNSASGREIDDWEEIHEKCISILFIQIDN